MRASRRLPPVLAFAALLASALLAACGSNMRKPDPHTMAPTTIDKQVVGRTTLAMPMDIPGQSVILIPFAIESEKDWYQTHDPYSAGGKAGISPSSNSLGLTTALSEGDFYRAVRWSNGGGPVRWHNAILRDLKSGEEWTILDRRGVISSWSCNMHQARRDAPFITCSLVFIATIEDTNHDGLLNDLDARIAIVTDADGRHPRIISPPGAQVWAVAFSPDDDRIDLQVVADTNGDGKFDYNDVPMPYVWGPSGNGPATPAVSEATLKRVEGLLK